MSVDITASTVEAGSDDRIEDAWELKEHIRNEDGVLKQRRRFFERAYRRATVHLLDAGGVGESRLAGFVAARHDGYLLFLAVAPEFRGEELGRRLVSTVAADHDQLSCHARASNENAVGFYEHLGFEIQRRIDGYYEDNGAAYYLTLGESGGLRERLSEFVKR